MRKQGHEVITKYTTTIASDKHYYTDSNGRELQVRYPDALVHV